MRVDAIDPAKTAMIVVDMQNDFVAPGAPMETPAARAVVPKVVEDLKICSDSVIIVIYTAHVHRRDGCDKQIQNCATACRHRIRFRGSLRLPQEHDWRVSGYPHY